MSWRSCNFVIAGLALTYQADNTDFGVCHLRAPYLGLAGSKAGQLLSSTPLARPPSAVTRKKAESALLVTPLGQLTHTHTSRFSFIVLPSQGTDFILPNATAYEGLGQLSDSQIFGAGSPCSSVAASKGQGQITYSHDPRTSSSSLSSLVLVHPCPLDYCAAQERYKACFPSCSLNIFQLFMDIYKNGSLTSPMPQFRCSKPVNIFLRLIF